MTSEELLDLNKITIQSIEVMLTWMDNSVSVSLDGKQLLKEMLRTARGQILINQIEPNDGEPQRA